MNNDIESLKDAVCAEVDRLAPQLLKASHDIHAHPELNFEEHYPPSATPAATTSSPPQGWAPDSPQPQSLNARAVGCASWARQPKKAEAAKLSWPATARSMASTPQ